MHSSIAAYNQLQQQETESGAGIPPWAESGSQWYVLVTGANGGLGYAICTRTIAEFFTSPARPKDQHLVLIISTRAFLKTRDAIRKLRLFLHRYATSSVYADQQRKRLAANGENYEWRDTSARVHFLGVELDLCDLRQIYNAAAKIKGDFGGLSGPDLLDGNGKEMADGKGKGLKDVVIPRLDVLILNAGIVGVSGIRWVPAVWAVLSDTQQALTWWDHNIPIRGAVVKTQGALASWEDDSDEEDSDGDSDNDSINTKHNNQTKKPERTQRTITKEKEPPLGEVFCANVFGHYILAHELMPLLNSTPSTNNESAPPRARIIWISSIEALNDSFSTADIQGLEAHDPYRSSKRLTDILALTANLPSVRAISAPWFATRPTSSRKSEGQKSEALSSAADEVVDNKPALYVTHPGICATGIVPLPLILQWAMVAAFYLARLLGSVWHPIRAYSGAVAPVWLTLAAQETLDDLEGENDNPSKKATTAAGKSKWGSATDFWGAERVKRTWVDGWGLDGTVIDDHSPASSTQKRSAASLKGRKRGTIDLTREAREEFEVLGREAWGEMERLRIEWEKRLGDGGFGWDD